MSCAPFDLRDYYFEELGAPERRQVREHVDRCSECAAELERLRVTAFTLTSIPEQEIPRRIAFVSDKVFEPSPMRRWLGTFWLSGMRMASAAALILAGAIVFHGTRIPSATKVIEVSRQQPNAAAVDQVALKAAIDQAVAKAVAQSEERYEAKLKQVAARNHADRSELMVRFNETLDHLEKRNNVLTASNGITWDAQ